MKKVKEPKKEAVEVAANYHQVLPPKRVFIGTVGDENGVILNSIVKANIPEEENIEITILEDSEILSILEKREVNRADKTVNDYINNKTNQMNALNLALDMEKNMDCKGKYIPVEKLISRLKTPRQASKELIGTLELFGLVDISVHPNNKELIKFLVTDKDRAEKKFRQLEGHMKFVRTIVNELKELGETIDVDGNIVKDEELKKSIIERTDKIRTC